LFVHNNALTAAIQALLAGALCTIAPPFSASRLWRPAIQANFSWDERATPRRRSMHCARNHHRLHNPGWPPRLIWSS